MKVTAAYLLLLLVATLAVPVAAQPVVSYAIPDIIAPGMNIYLELIGPAYTTGNFGTDGFYLNNATDAVRVELVNAADLPSVAVGPVVVSWDGRMISTQLFAKSTRAPGSPIQLRVTVNGISTTTPVSIGVVTPQSVGTNGVLSGGGPIGGGGLSGTLSPNGTMIVDSLILTAGTYRPGQGNYFPLIILSKGRIEVAANSLLLASAGSSLGMDGGAGGGGGGGRSCDILTTDRRTVGGGGFTGGSGGADNMTARSRLAPGAATGPNGTSANGALGGFSGQSCFEGGAGGTGHPFGRGAQSIWCAPGDDFNGEYGGATVAGEQSGGGGGGYRTDGTNGALSNNNRGRTHGNFYGVPVAGGSGGASGNPQAAGGGCSGWGGGGGGAIVLYSMTRLDNNYAVYSQGGLGGAHSGGGGSGGGGSGGMVELGAKVPTSIGGIVVLTGGGGSVSGNRGGDGGLGLGRGDGFVADNGPTPASTMAIYQGPTIDTLTERDSARIVLTGTMGTGFARTDFRIYIRSDATGSQWSSLGSPATVTGRSWQLPVTVPASGTYYVVIVQDVSAAGPGADAFNRNPSRVMSQAGANIIRLDLIPKINTLPNRPGTLAAFGPVSCSDTDLDSVKIWNGGDAPLIINPAITGPNASDFQLPNAAQRTLNPGDTIYLLVRFAPATPGTKTAMLDLPNNDPRAGKNPYTFPLTGTKSLIQPSLTGTNPIDFGVICKGAVPADRSIQLDYVGDVASSLVEIRPVGLDATNGFFTVVAPTGLPQPLTVGGTPATITIRFRPTVARAYSGSFKVIVGRCDTLVIQVRGTSVEPTIAVTPQPLDFGSVQVNVPKALQFIITNTSASAVKVRSVMITPAGPFVLTPGLIGSTIAPGASVPGNVTFTPTASGDFTARLCVEVEEAVNGICPLEICTDLEGKGVISLLVLSDRALLFEADTCADPAGQITHTFTLSNRETAPERITAVTTANGRVTVTSAPSLPIDLGVNESITFTVKWTPGAAGAALSDQVIITTSSPNPAQQRMVVDMTLVHERSLLALYDAVGAPLASDARVTFPYVFSCTPPPTREIVIRNAGTLVEGYTIRLLKGTAFSFSASAPGPIAAGTDRRITVTFSPPAAGEFQDTLEIVSGRCGVVMRVPLAGGRYDLRYTVRGAAFGPSNVGVTRTGTVSIAFDSTTPEDVRVHVVSVTPGTGTGFTMTSPAPLPRDLSPKEALTVAVGFTPSAEQAYTGQVCFHIDSPCDTTICADLTGTGIRSNILVRTSSLDFGSLYICQQKELEFLVENTGSSALTLQTLTPGGPDAGLFEILEPLPTALPMAIAANSSLRVRIRFVPAQGTSDGLKTATLTIVSDDATQGSITVALVGERRRQVLVAATGIDFGAVELGQTVEKSVTLENRTADPVTIDRLTLPAPFVIVDPIIPPALTLPPGGTLAVRVSFSPVDTNMAEEQLLASQRLPCTEVTSIPVRGKGKITVPEVRVGAVTVVIPDDLGGRPGQELSIPFVLERSQALAETGAKTFRATVRFNGSMLLPTAARSRSGAMFKPVTGAVVSGGRIVSSEIIGADRVVTVEIANDTLPTAPDTLGFLDVTVALGNAVTTPVSIDTLFFNDGSAAVTVTTGNGLVTLAGYCTTGGNRLVEVTGAAKISTITPNPATSSTEIIFETSESGPSTLVILDATGSRVATLVDNETLPAHAHMVMWDTGRLASGVYYAVLRTPTEQISRSVVVVR